MHSPAARSGRDNVRAKFIFAAAGFMAAAVACLEIGFPAQACSLILWNTSGQAAVAAQTWDLFVAVQKPFPCSP